MRIFLAVLRTETNTFAPLPTGLSEFRQFALDGPVDKATHPFAALVRAVRERTHGHELIYGRIAFAMRHDDTHSAPYATSFSTTSGRLYPSTSSCSDCMAP